MSEFPTSMMNRLIRKVANVRVSRSAAIELGAVLEEYAIELSKEAVKLTKHRSAKTVNESDIRAAASRIRT
ncbi:MAG: histone [Candidatus Hadarchaeaceae archaeon]